MVNVEEIKHVLLHLTFLQRKKKLGGLFIF